MFKYLQISQIYIFIQKISFHLTTVNFIILILLLKQIYHEGTKICQISNIKIFSTNAIQNGAGAITSFFF